MRVLHRSAVGATFLLAVALAGMPRASAQSPLTLLARGNGGEAAPAETAAKGEAAPTPPSGPEPFPLAQLARAVTETTTLIREVEGRLASDAWIRTIRSELPPSSTAIDGLEAMLRSSDPLSLSARALTDRRLSWKRIDTRLGEWEKSLERQATSLQEDRQGVRRMEERWRATIEVLRAESAPQKVLDGAGTLLARLAASEAPLRERLREMLLLQEAIAFERIRLAEGIRILDDATVRAQERIFAQRSRPIWRIFETAGAPGLYANVVQTLRDKRDDVREFQETGHGAIGGLAVLCAALVAVAAWVRRIARRLPQGTVESRIVRERPWASAILLSLVLWLFFHIDAPRPVLEIVTLSMLLPIYRLLTLRLPPVLHRSLAILFGLAVVERLRGLVSDDSWAGRVGVLVISVVAALALLRMLRRRGPWREMEANPWIRASVRVGWGAAIALGVGVAANVVGQSVLADTIARGTLVALVFGTMLFGATLVVEGWLEVAEASGVATGKDRVGAEARRLTAILSSLTRATAVFLWFLAVLNVFGLARPLVGALRGVLAAPWTIGEVSISLGNVLGFAAALGAGLVLSRVLKLLLDHAVFPRFEMPRGVPAAISTTLQYFVATLGFLVAVFASGIEMSRFTILAGAVGVGIGFGLQNIVNNFVSGLILLYERPIQKGDTIEMGTLRGNVHRIGVRSSTVRTFDGAEVIVPNATLISSDVTNWTLSDRLRRVEVPVGVSYGSDPRKVIAILEEVARSNPAVLEKPAPAVLFQGFGESSLDFALRVWTSDFDDWIRLRSDLHLAVFEALSREKIEIPFPQRDVHMK
jgi:small-conductance mechanosensitive channel